MGEPSRHTTCRRCYRRLSQVTDNRGQHAGWLHPGGHADHPPDPAPEADAGPSTTLCDFCNEPQPAWSYPCIPWVDHSTTPANASDDAWLACTGCAALIDADAYQQLAARSAANICRRNGLPATARPAVQQHITHIQLQFRSMRAGPPQPTTR